MLSEWMQIIETFTAKEELWLQQVGFMFSMRIAIKEGLFLFTAEKHIWGF